MMGRKDKDNGPQAVLWGPERVKQIRVGGREWLAPPNSSAWLKIREVIDQRQDTETPAAHQRVGDEVEGPAQITVLRDGHALSPRIPGRRTAAAHVVTPHLRHTLCRITSLTTLTRAPSVSFGEQTDAVND
jgi:hypothetical protein